MRNESPPALVFVLAAGSLESDASQVSPLLVNVAPLGPVTWYGAGPSLIAVGARPEAGASPTVLPSESIGVESSIINAPSRRGVGFEGRHQSG